MDASYCQDWSSLDCSFHVLELRSSLLTFRSAMLRVFWYFLRLVIPVHVRHLQKCREFFQHGAYCIVQCEEFYCLGCDTVLSGINSSMFWENLLSWMCSKQVPLKQGISTRLPHLTFQIAVFSTFSVMIGSGHASPSLFLCSVSIKFVSDLWNLYSVIQEERSVFWEVKL